MHGDHSEELFYPLVLPFSQPIRLGMEYCQHVLINSQLVTERSGKVRGEAWVSVRDDFVWEAKPLVDIFEVQLSDPLSSD